jgi:lactate dehydrogenase-like 2-hydroxyacid dehydrogenase
VVAVSCALPEPVRVLLEAPFRLHAAPLRDRSPDAFAENLATAPGPVRALVVAPGDPVDDARIAALPPSVRGIASYSTGLDHVDLSAAAARGLLVTNTPDVLTDATADVALLLILAAVRGAGRAAAVLREGAWDGWAPDQIWGHDLRGRTLGVVGPGRIGVATARRAVALGLAVRYWSARRRSPELDALGATAQADWLRFLGGTDVLTLHCPSTPGTRRLIDARALAALPRGAVLVNTARGDLLDEDAVLAALASGHLAAVGLDVYANEPALDPRWRSAPGAVLLPHIGSATHETRLAMGRAVLDGLHRILGRH